MIRHVHNTTGRVKVAGRTAPTTAVEGTRFGISKRLGSGVDC